MIFIIFFLNSKIRLNIIFLELKNKIEYYLYIILLYKNKIGRNVLFLLQSISLMAK